MTGWLTLCYKVLVMKEPVALHEHALDNLRYIRSTMERAGTFTAVPGWGTVAVGVTALAAAAVSAFVLPHHWLAVWLAEAGVAGVIATATILTKARALAFSLTGAPMRRFLLAFAPPLVAGGVLTRVLWSAGHDTLLPPLWLLLYGTAVTAGGAISVRIVPVMGLLFMAAGIASFFLPFAAMPYVLAATFGIVHIVFGIIIARRHGG